MQSFPEEMHLVMREYGSGLYSIGSYFFPKVIAEVDLLNAHIHRYVSHRHSAPIFQRAITLFL